MQLDFRFVEIDYEIWALGQYLDIIERNIPHLSKTERDRLLASISSHHGSDEDYLLVSQEADRIEEDVIPRHLRGSFIVALWAVFEGAVISITKHIQQVERLKLSLKDVRGDFLDRAMKYFDYIVEFALIVDPSDWEKLRNIEMIRHIIAHSNSRLNDLDPNKRKQITAILNSGI